MSSSDWRPGSSPATTSGARAPRASRGRPGRPARSGRRTRSSRLRAESQHTNAARSRTALSSSRACVPVRAGGADERAGPQPLAAQHGVGRGRDRDDDVLQLRRHGGSRPARRRPRGRTPRAAPRSGSRRRLRSIAGSAARMHATWRARLLAAADHAERPRARTGEVLRGDRACRARAQLAEHVGLDHGPRLAALRRARPRTPRRRRSPRRSSRRRARASGRPPT